MELRGQDKDIGMPSSFGYNPPNREPSSKLSSSSIIPPVGETRNESGRANTILNPSQTLDQDHLLHHHQFNLQHQQQRPIQGRDIQNPDPDPAPAPAPISVTGATSIRIASGSNSKPVATPLAPPPLNNNCASTIRYRECLKNHAATMGGHSVDGCGEFMPGGEEGTQEALKCAACDCHRNFHRKEIDGESQYNANKYYTFNPSKNSSRRNTTIPPSQFPPPFPAPPPSSHHHHHHHPTTSPSTVPIPPMMMAFGGVPAESSSEDLNVFHSNVGVQPSAQQHQQQPSSFSLSKKRFRTKFSQEQKDKMMEFAEKLGWKIQKQDEQQVGQFCAEVGIKRQVFKVWMHNNKQAMKKKQL
ncbi:hypothetical protein L1049_023800 [Liquidambar formosana]|uniref:ZF-HD dimerization-type domain-containing protein n=1 Tax=Liquidambar formosana TaxID=63359 RepID=A0AAP0RV30_LIQFO